MLRVSEENHLLKRRFTRAIEAIMADETIPLIDVGFHYKEYHHGIPAKVVGQYLVQKPTEYYNLGPKKDASNVARSTLYICSEPGTRKFVSVYEGAVYEGTHPHVKRPRLGLKAYGFETNKQGYFDGERPEPRRYSAFRGQMNEIVEFLEDEVLNSYAAKPISEVTDEEMYAELQMLITRVVGTKDVYYHPNEDFWIKCRFENGFMYSLATNRLGNLEVLSRKLRLEIIKAENKRPQNMVSLFMPRDDAWRTRDLIRGFILLLREILKEIKYQKTLPASKPVELKLVPHSSNAE